MSGPEDEGEDKVDDPDSNTRLKRTKDLTDNQRNKLAEWEKKPGHRDKPVPKTIAAIIKKKAAYKAWSTYLSGTDPKAKIPSKARSADSPQPAASSAKRSRPIDPQSRKQPASSVSQY
jgi:hypothetical protein